VNEAPFRPTITGPIDDPRATVDATELAVLLFDEKTRARLQRLAEEMKYSPFELIREGTLRYLDRIEGHAESSAPDSPEK
jgi:hypothetical protein